MFVSILSYQREVDRGSDLFASHREFVEARIADGVLLCSGPRIGVAGGVMLARGEDEAALRRTLDSDPFVEAGLATYELVGFRVGLADPASGLAPPAAG